MRRRSEVGPTVDRMLEQANAAEPFPKQARCPVEGCGKPLLSSPSGVTCANGHGGEVARERAQTSGEAPEDPQAGESEWRPPVERPLEGIKKDAPASGVDGERSAGLRVVSVNASYERIVETIYSVDAAREYADLEQHLEIGEERANYQTILRHLDQAERRARNAHRLYLGARLERKRWDQQADRVLSALRKKATEALEHDKALGDKSKRITNDDVQAEMRRLFDDELSDQEIRRERYKGMEEQLLNDSETWKSRCRTLQTILSTLRK